MRRKVRTKRIYLNEGHTKYCIVRLYKKKSDMQNEYELFGSTKNKVCGAHCAYDKIIIKKGKREVLSPETGTVFLNLSQCGAGIVCHELAHAVLWAHKHKSRKKQYPIIIKNMDDEEEILYHLTYAIRQFYTWYWEVKKIL